MAIKILPLFCFFIFAPLVLNAKGGGVDEELRFTRSECIVKVHFYWPKNMPDEEQEMYINKLFTEDKRAAIEHHKPQIASMRFGTNDRSHLYLQYRTKCNKKREITEDYLGGQLIGRIPGFPKYKILNEVILPHPSTIDSYGRWWIDGMPTNH